MSGVRRTKSRVTIQLKSKEKEALSHRRVSCSRVRGQGGVFPGQQILRTDNTLVLREGWELANPLAKTLGLCLVDFPVCRSLEICPNAFGTCI